MRRKHYFDFLFAVPLTDIGWCKLNISSVLNRFFFISFDYIPVDGTQQVKLFAKIDVKNLEWKKAHKK